MSKRERTQCEVVRHVYPGIPGQGTTTRTPQAGGARADRISGRRAPQAGEAAGARRAAVAARLAACRATPLADECRLTQPGTTSTGYHEGTRDVRGTSRVSSCSGLFVRVPGDPADHLGTERALALELAQHADPSGGHAV